MDRSNSDKLLFLDGLRGWAAVGVVLFHLFGNDSHHFAALRWTMSFGRYSVAVFIVLSGYCLMLAAGPDGRLRGGLWSYLGRRGRRILPGYYAALMAGIAIRGLPSAPNLVSHLLLLHNARPEWARAINAPLWSVATEWQIYFLFPVVLLPVVRRWGQAAAIGVGFLVGLLPVVATGGRWFAWASPWFVGLFTLGMAAVGVSRSRVSGRWFLPGGILLLALEFSRVPPPWTGVLGDTLVGLMACLTIILLCEGGGKARILLEHPISLWLGSISYSIYLTHTLVLGQWLPQLGEVLVLIAVIGVAWAFSLIFERPFLTRRSRFTQSPGPAAP